MWIRLVNVGLGIWLMAAPDVLSFGDPARTVQQILGPLIASMAIIAMSEVMRPLRWVNVLFGGALVVLPWLLPYAGWTRWQSIAIGLIVMGCGLVRGRIEERVGGGWTALWRPLSDVQNGRRTTS